jgi:hypothetical protein
MCFAGIKYSGTSHILLSSDQVSLFERSLGLPFPRATPARPTDFESLSPIQFPNALELSMKLSTLRPKSKKGREYTDNSQANKQFVTASDGILRGAFEHGRCVIIKQAIQFNSLIPLCISQRILPYYQEWSWLETIWSRGRELDTIVSDLFLDLQYLVHGPTE